MHPVWVQDEQPSLALLDSSHEIPRVPLVAIVLDKSLDKLFPDSLSSVCLPTKQENQVKAGEAHE
jgi:hypothetical protein